MPSTIALNVNTRVLAKPTAGVQRYLAEILQRLQLPFQRRAPHRKCQGVAGHLWEQLALPRLVGDSLLWSPSHTGPLSVARQVVTMPDVIPFDCAETLNPRFARWYRFIMRRLGRKVLRIITVSEFTRRRLQELDIAGDNITVIYPGALASVADATPADASNAARELHLPSSGYILSLCSLEPRKNLGRLLQVWRALAPRLPSSLWLVLAGGVGNPNIYASPQLGSLPPRTFVTGRVPAALVPGLYRGAHAFVYPSLYEGFGIPPVEAMAAGIPVLTGNRSAIPEVVGEAALQVDPEDTAMMAEALERIVLDDALREQLCLAGRARARLFTWERCAAATEQVLRHAVEA